MYQEELEKLHWLLAGLGMEWSGKHMSAAL